MFDLFEDFTIDIEDVFDAGEELAVFLRLSGRGRESGAQVDARMAHVWTIREGRAIRLRQYLDRAAALEAVRLSREDAHASSGGRITAPPPGLDVPLAWEYCRARNPVVTREEVHACT